MISVTAVLPFLSTQYYNYITISSVTNSMFLKIFFTAYWVSLNPLIIEQSRHLDHFRRTDSSCKISEFVNFPQTIIPAIQYLS